MVGGVPRLHLVTDDDVLASEGFAGLARDALEAADGPVALHLRGPRTPVRELLSLARILEPIVTRSGAWLVINDRVDLAAIVAARGVQLGGRSLPCGRVRALRAAGLLPRHLRIGVSVHAPAEAEPLAGVDWLVAGTVFASGSHPGRPGGGLGLVRDVVAASPAPVVAIGGMTPQRVGDVIAAGAHGVAALGGVWRPPGGSTTRAVQDYLQAFASAAPDPPSDTP